MKHKLPCEIIQDLLPSYVDGLTSEVTNEAVSEHVESCEACREMLHRMQEPEPAEADEQQEKTIDFLKKTRKKTHRIVVISIVAAIVFIVAVLFAQLYVVGNEIYADSILCQPTVSQNRLSISGTLVDSARGVSDITFEEKDGVVNISFKATLVSMFHTGDFAAEYEAEDTITQVKIGDRIIWDHGENISAETSAVYNAKHLYVGDMVANGTLASALGMPEVLGEFQNSLQTTEEPYGWSIYLQREIQPVYEDQMLRQMTSFGYLLLATIDNLDHLEFSYKNTDSGYGSCIVTQKDATLFLGKDIKTCADTAADLQNLMKQVAPQNIPSRIIKEDDLSQLIVTNASDAPIYEVRITYSVQDDFLQSQGWGGENGCGIGKWKERIYSFLKVNAKSRYGENQEVTYQMEVKDKDGNSYPVAIPEDSIVEYGTTKEYDLTGDFENGFRLEVKN